MDCQNLRSFNQFQVRLISAYLKKKDARNHEEKQRMAAEYIEKNSTKMRKEFCSECQMCSLKRSKYANIQTMALSMEKA